MTTIDNCNGTTAGNDTSSGDGTSVDDATTGNDTCSYNTTTTVSANVTVYTYQYTLSVSAPPDGNKAPPTYYWLHVLDQGGFTASGKWVAGKWVPAARGPPMRVVRANGFVSSAVTEAKITRWDKVGGGSSGGSGKGRWKPGKFWRTWLG